MSTSVLPDVRGTTRFLAGYQKLVQSRVEQLLDDATRRSRGGPFDLVAEFASPLPIMVISDMLGMNGEQAVVFRSEGAALGGALDGVTSIRQGISVKRAIAAIFSVLDPLIDDRRVNPRDDLISVVASVIDDGTATRDEIRYLCALLFVAGYETTTNLIGNAVRALVGHPEQWELLVKEPHRIPDAVEEVLRWESPVQETVRIALQDNEIAGTTIEAGEMVWILLAAANRDPEMYQDPARFDITRTPGVEHLAFASGPHDCLGAPLARMEAVAALTALVTRFPRLRIQGEPPMRSSRVVRAASRIVVSS